MSLDRTIGALTTVPLYIAAAVFLIVGDGWSDIAAGLVCIVMGSWSLYMAARR